MPEYQPQDPIRDYFLGAWKLASTEVRYPDGHTTPYAVAGPNGIGFLIYTSSGHMFAEIMKPDRPTWENVEHPTAAEAESALDGFTSYCGTFEIREDERAIVHRPETASIPNWVGTEQRRPYYIVSQKRFFFRGRQEDIEKDGTKIVKTWTITWERLK